MAKTPVTQQSKPAANTRIIPAETDARAELFYLLGNLRGQGAEGANRIAELVIELTRPIPQTETEPQE